MKTSERFNKVYTALSRAFFNGTLKKGDCTACAVGNIFLEYGAPISLRVGILSNSSWGYLFITNLLGKRSKFVKDEHSDEESKYARQLIELNGYSVEEMAEVEHIFETNTKINWSEYYNYSREEVMEDQYNGLCAIVEYLLSLEDSERIVIDSYKNHLKTYEQFVSN